MEAVIDPLVLSVDEVASALRVSRSIVWRMTRAGQIHSIHVGKRVLVPRHEVERILREGV